jgi:hypothetical protein
MKKGQIMGLPILMIFGLIVGAFILFFGIKWLGSLTEEANYVDFLDRMKDLDNNIDTFQNYDKGSSKVFTLEFPEDVERVCFYDSSQGSDCLDDGKECSADLEGMFDLVKSDEYNVYVMPPNVYDQNRLKLEDFKTSGGNPICVSNGGNLVLVSADGYVEIQYYE